LSIQYVVNILSARLSGTEIYPPILVLNKLQSVQNSLTRVVLPSLRHLSASERFSYLHCLLSTTKYSSKSLHLPIRPWQSVSDLISTISSNYTSHHELSVLQPSNYSKYHICPQNLVGAKDIIIIINDNCTILVCYVFVVSSFYVFIHARLMCDFNKSMNISIEQDG